MEKRLPAISCRSTARRDRLPVKNNRNRTKTAFKNAGASAIRSLKIRLLVGMNIFADNSVVPNGTTNRFLQYPALKRWAITRHPFRGCSPSGTHKIGFPLTAECCFLPVVFSED